MIKWFIEEVNLNIKKFSFSVKKKKILISNEKKKTQHFSFPHTSCTADPASTYEHGSDFNKQQSKLSGKLSRSFQQWLTCPNLLGHGPGMTDYMQILLLLSPKYYVLHFPEGASKIEILWTQHIMLL